ncbi:MAG: hypothetical protein ONB46_25140 [candidate division KSB1 bacterium]|nr:hypothetical protein [candidate division KSB1 bacterium]MDZ7369184.1 hypothetical protein [candidate division KSB1 bacterium]MDZ7407181.1 hypothetical protein [candidate division KSB1 bacterium]
MARLPGAMIAMNLILICVSMGFSAGTFFWAVAESLMVTSRPLSIVDLKDVTGYLRERILTEGRVIYGAKGISEGTPVWAREFGKGEKRYRHLSKKHRGFWDTQFSHSLCIDRILQRAGAFDDSASQIS